MSARSRRLLVRADANGQMGAGHVMRCMALAQTWRKYGGEVIFQSAELLPGLRERLTGEGIGIEAINWQAGSTEDAKEMRATADEWGAGWVVVDGYQFGAGYRKVVREAGRRLLLIDDVGQEEECQADYVLNQNGEARAEMYPQCDGRLLLGPKFVLLRQEFLTGHGARRPTAPRAEKLLVTFGGADAQRVTLKSVEALEMLSEAAPEATILIGAAHPARKEIESVTARGSLRAEIISDARDMAKRIAESDLAVCAPGTTCWEMAYMGVPIITIALAENQLGNARFLERRGFSRYLGWHADVSPVQIGAAIRELSGDVAARREMAERGQELVDGHGAFRLWLRMNEERLKLRRATAEDRERVWGWSNGPEVRAMSFSSESIPWAKHVQWFDQKLRDPQCVFWMGEDDGGHAVGQARFDRREREAVISVTVDAGWRGSGLGSLLIWLASRRFFAENDAELIRAFIKPENGASLRAFAKADYRPAKGDVVRGQPAAVMILQRRDCE